MRIAAPAELDRQQERARFMTTPITIERLDKRKLALRVPSRDGGLSAVTVAIWQWLRQHIKTVSPDVLAIDLDDPLGLEGRSRLAAELPGLPPDIIEMQALVQLSSHAAATLYTHPVPLQMLQRAFAHRAVELLRANPVLAHPKLCGPSRNGGADQSIIGQLLDCPLPLDPDQLQAAALAQPQLGALLCKAVMEDKFNPFGRQLDGGRNSTIMLRAMLRVAPQAWKRTLKQGDLLRWAKHCASNCRLAADYQQTLALLDELNACIASDGVGTNFLWDCTALRESLARDGVLKVEHPVLALVYHSVRDSAYYGVYRSHEDHEPPTPGYPAAPLTALAERINTLLLPDARLPLDSIRAHDFLRHVTLAHRTDSPEVKRYWESLDADSGEPAALSPQSFVDWALERRDSLGHQVEIGEIERCRLWYDNLMGIEPTARMAATVTCRTMDQAISAPTPAPAQPANPTASSLPVRPHQAARPSRSL